MHYNSWFIKFEKKRKRRITEIRGMLMVWHCSPGTATKKCNFACNLIKTENISRFFFTLHWPKNQLWNKTLNDIFFHCYFSTPAESHPSSCISKIFKRKICIFANDGFICLICILKLLRKMHAWRLGETRGGQRGSIFKCSFSKWKTLWYYKNK